MVELRNVTVCAGKTCILDDVSVRLPSNRFSVILGPNGAGKSTLLRVASGMLEPTSGDVSWHDRKLESIDNDERARIRAVLSQHVELAFPLPAIDVVMMGRYPHFDRVPLPNDYATVHRALQTVDMESRAEQAYPTMSGGEQQKVQLARVLAQISHGEARADSPASPHRYLFLDEPTASLDIHHQIHLLDVARSLVANDVTVIAILHDLNVALEYGEHFVFMQDGRIALETDDREAIRAEDLERIFQVRARRLDDQGRAYWRFGL